MPRLGPESPGLGDPKIGSESLVPGEAKKESTAIRSRFGTSPEDWVRPRWGPDSPCPGEAQVVTRVPVSGRGPGKDQIHQIQEAHVGTESPGMGEVLEATPLTSSR